MSKDLKFERICDHRITEEQIIIESDQKTLKLARFVSSSDTKLFVNGFKIEKDDPLNGWTLEIDSEPLYFKRSKIIFKNKRKAIDDFFQVTYSVETKYCPKCRGLKVINDLSFNVYGKNLIVENEDKLLQEIRKGLITQLGSNPFHEWVGTRIHELIGAKAYNVEVIRTRLVQEIVTFIGKYTNLQEQQSFYQEVTDREFFNTVLSINVTPQYASEATYWIVEIIFNNRDESSLLFEKRYALPPTYSEPKLLT